MHRYLTADLRPVQHCPCQDLTTSGQGPLWGWLLVGAVAAGRGSVRVFEGLLVRVLLTLVIGFNYVGGLCFLPVAMVLAL